MGQSLETVLLQNAIAYKSEPMRQTVGLISVEKWWEVLVERTPVKYISLLLVSIGAPLLWKFPEGYFRHSLGETAILAGLLVLLVDPFLKARLLKEASKDIFHYLLGFDQQPEIKDRLKSLVFDTKVFRKGFHMRCTFVPVEDAMRLELECDFEVINPTNEIHRYSHAIQCEKVEKPEVHLMTLISDQDAYSFVPDRLESKKDDPEVLEARAKEIGIAPSTKGLTYTFGAKFSMTYPEEFFYAVHVGTPTIGMTIEVVPPPGFAVTASPTPTFAKNIWKYDKLFMPGEHVDIRWQRLVG